jgi:uncharacterized protein
MNGDSHVQESLVEIRTSPIHGRGGFARIDIRKGTHVIEYVGERISKQESLRRCEADNPYIFSLSDNEDLDGDVEWNPARFLNHSCEPNCDADLEDGHIWIIARRTILAGTEITFNYGYDLEDYKLHPCLCHTPGCVGYIVAEVFFDTLRRQAAYKEPKE